MILLPAVGHDFDSTKTRRDKNDMMCSKHAFCIDSFFDQHIDNSKLIGHIFCCPKVRLRLAFAAYRLCLTTTSSFAMGIIIESQLTTDTAL